MVFNGTLAGLVHFLLVTLNLYLQLTNFSDLLRFETLQTTQTRAWLLLMNVL